jgi:plastocyanin
MVAKGSSRVQVGAFEFRFQLSRLRVKAGRVTVQLVNYGEDDHDLRFRRVGGTHLFKLPLTHPGEASQLTAKLRAGTFNLWCSLPGHKAAGMHAKLRVVRP